MINQEAATKFHGERVILELPAKLRSACDGPGVTCVASSDHHSRWDTVLATEPIMANAQTKAAVAVACGFGTMNIEKDVQCSNGARVYEVARARFMSHAAAAELVARAKTAGFANARTEDSSRRHQMPILRSLQGTVGGM